MTEKFKRPFKKRHSSIYHQPTNRVNKYLSQAIEARSVDRDKSAHVRRITLRFRDRDKERQYHQDLDLGFSLAMGCSILLLMLSAALQVRTGFLFSSHLLEINPPFFSSLPTTVDRLAKNPHSAAALPDRVHLDQCHLNAPLGSAPEMDLLGPRPEFRTETGDHRLYHHFVVFCWPSECGE